jgi:hypothetical protein
MGININPGYHYCNTTGQNVATEQTEGECRDQHSCSDVVCLLETKFTPARWPNAFSLLAPFPGERTTSQK